MSGIAHHYFLDDRPEASVPATRLRNILDSLQRDQRLSALALNYLEQQGFLALMGLARGEIAYEAFSKVAAAEQAERRRVAEAQVLADQAAQLVEQADQAAREASRAADYAAARDARERDPKYIARLESRRLRARYGLDQFIEMPLFARLMDILRHIDDGNRLTDQDVLWLKTDGRDCFSESLKSAFHEREATFFAAEYIRTRDPWNAVNASGHYRRCDEPGNAHDLLTSIPPDRHAAPKLKSAILTTHGGVMRDLGRSDEALELGAQAHALTPKDFRPCTLLGAVHIEVGNLQAGWEWYRRAEERGASERSIDHELRGIFLRAGIARREEIRSFLLREDPARYEWVRGRGH
jgi:hypothetical protein